MGRLSGKRALVAVVGQGVGRASLAMANGAEVRPTDPDEAARRAFTACQPTNRLRSRAETSAPVAHLTSDEPSHATGHVVGGWTNI